MVSELSLPALFGHFATLLHNPNNLSREVARTCSVIEDEAIAMLAAMLGFDPKVARGHFTSGGTVANFEGVWRARYRMDHGLALGLWRAERDGRYNLALYPYLDMRRYPCMNSGDSDVVMVSFQCSMFAVIFFSFRHCIETLMSQFVCAHTERRPRSHHVC